MITENIQKDIISIWDKYIADNKKTHNTKGKEIEDIDEKRKEAIQGLQLIIDDFLSGNIDIHEFKTDIDSFNKQNNYWGFTSIKGQMFFNLLVKTCESEDQIQKLTALLQQCITEPKDLEDALSKIVKLEKYTKEIFDKAPDKRKAPNPGSVCYFLSYFWQIHNPIKWPVMFSSIIESFTHLGLWEETKTQQQAYRHFFTVNEEIKEVLSKYSRRTITNWEAEHSFWNFKPLNGHAAKHSKQKGEVISPKIDATDQPIYKASFDVFQYVIPAVSNLVELGSTSEKSGSAKGSNFEKVVAEIFKQLDFEVDILGQGTGRNPDAIVKFKQEHTAFIIDAKAYGSGYSLGIDDRAIKEYINHYCPLLRKDGFTKTGFIIVSNSFKTNFESFINEITWNTDIKRFVLMESEALLHLLAYKNKEKLSLSTVIESIISFGNKVTKQDVIQKFDDV